MPEPYIFFTFQFLANDTNPTSVETVFKLTSLCLITPSGCDYSRDDNKGIILVSL